MREMTWTGAGGVALVAVTVAALALAVVPHLLVSRLTVLPREGRVLLATAYEVVAFIAVAWGAWRWQRRGSA